VILNHSLFHRVFSQFRSDHFERRIPPDVRERERKRNTARNSRNGPDHAIWRLIVWTSMSDNNVIALIPIHGDRQLNEYKRSGKWL
jgi:hypothetical protein